jgi:hypothetical protein
MESIYVFTGGEIASVTSTDNLASEFNIFAPGWITGIQCNPDSSLYWPPSPPFGGRGVLDLNDDFHIRMVQYQMSLLPNVLLAFSTKCLRNKVNKPPKLFRY